MTIPNIDNIISPEDKSDDSRLLFIVGAAFGEVEETDGKVVLEIGLGCCFTGCCSSFGIGSG
jgi:hypothetical protein